MFAQVCRERAGEGGDEEDSSEKTSGRMVWDLNFIRIRSRRRSIFLTLGYVNNLGLRARSPGRLSRCAGETQPSAIAINNFIGYRAGPRARLLLQFSCAGYMGCPLGKYFLASTVLTKPKFPNRIYREYVGLPSKY